MATLKKPLITEKISAMNEQGVYGFAVEKTATPKLATAITIALKADRNAATDAAAAVRKTERRERDLSVS